MSTQSEPTPAAGQPAPPPVKVVPPPAGESARNPAKRPNLGANYVRSAKVEVSRKIPITHLRVVTGKTPETAAIEVSTAAADAHAPLQLLGVRVEIEQILPNPDTGSPRTAGVNGDGMTEIAVRLVHAKHGPYLSKTCENTVGPNSPRIATETILLAFNAVDFHAWLASKG